MIILTCINEKLKRVDIIKMSGISAIKYVRAIYYIPPQRRFVRIVTLRSTTKYDEENYEYYIHSMIARMMPTIEELHIWASYPIYFHTRRLLNYG